MENVNGLMLDMVADLYKRAQEGERYYGESLDVKFEIQALEARIQELEARLNDYGV